MRRIKWATSAAATLLGGAFVLLFCGAVAGNDKLVTQAGALALIGIGAALLALHER